MKRVTCLALVCLSIAAAQTAPVPAFSYRVASASSPAPVTANGTIQFGPVPVGQTSSVTFTIINTTAESFTLTRAVAGGTGFAQTSRLPITLRSGDSHPFELTYLPEARGPGTGTLSVELRTGERSFIYAFVLAATAITPDLIFSYLLPGGNQTPVNEGESISFASTIAGQTATGTVFITNRGNGPATVTRIQSGGAEAFRITGLPLLPIEIAADRDLRFSVAFAPTSSEAALGFIRIETSAGSRTILLQGRGTTASLAYFWRRGTNIESIAPGGQVSTQDTSVGSSSAGMLTIRNDGNAEGRVTSVSVSGTAFALGDLPALPATLLPGTAVNIPVVFTPREAGVVTGRLRIDGNLFELTATGLGARLQVSASVASGIILMTPSSLLTFPNTALGRISDAALSIRNDGNTEASISSISISGSSFRIEGLPTMPMRIPAGDSREFRVRFAPDSIDALSGSLLIDDLRFNLRGTGSAPEPLGDVLFRLVGDTVDPLQQPMIALSLSKPAEIPLTGRLSLSFNSDSFSDDRTVQFATGGRTVDFRIAAGSTDAIFGESSKQVLFQAGTVAGQIAATATFQYGNVVLTPQPAPIKQITIARREPVLRSVSAVPKSAGTFELVITGYSTPRSLQRLNLLFTPAPGKQLSTTSLTADVESAFSAWYTNSASSTFGSQFTATLTLTVSGDTAAIQSIGISAVNPSGTSGTVSANLGP